MIKITEDVSQWQTMSNLIQWMNGEGAEFYPLVVDIGANDGKTLSNSWTFIVENEWRGILVEPVVESLIKAFKHFDQVKIPESRYTLVNLAVSDSNQTQQLWVGGEHDMLSSFVQKPSDKAIPCTCITPRELFDKHHVTDVGVLSVDTEGHDFPILRSLIQETEVRPQIIITESWPHLIYDNVEKHSLLFNEGYTKILHCGENEIFYRRR